MKTSHAGARLWPDVRCPSPGKLRKTPQGRMAWNGGSGLKQEGLAGKMGEKLHTLGLVEQVNILEASLFSVSDGNYKYTERGNWVHSSFLSLCIYNFRCACNFSLVFPSVNLWFLACRHINR